jgi:transposase-like protein
MLSLPMMGTREGRMRRKPTVGVVAESRYWRESTARVMVDAWRESGETVAAFAMRHGVDRRRLARWVRRVEPRADIVVPFHPVRVVGDAEARLTHAPIEIAVGSTYRVRVPPGFEGEDLRRVLAVLAWGGSC